MKIGENTIAICLATYNGGEYLSQQLDSILSQTYEDFVLFIRDDNSSDNTLEIINNYLKKYSNKIKLIDDKTLVGGSSKKNFAAIVKYVNDNYSFNYYMFSDQDDFWKNDKVEICIKKMKELEFNNKCPILIHTDLTVVDASLNVLGDSFIKYRSLNPKIQDISHLLVQNNITGCTMLWNRQLNEIVDLDSENVAMHDWWMALVASCFGKIAFINIPTILYRQHGNNVVGATRVNSFSFIIKRLLGGAKVKQTFLLSFQQAESFLEVYDNILSDEQKDILINFIKIKNVNKVKRIYKIFKGKYLKQGFVQIIGQIVFI